MAKGEIDLYINIPVCLAIQIAKAIGEAKEKEQILYMAIAEQGPWVAKAYDEWAKAEEKYKWLISLIGFSPMARTRNGQHKMG